MKYAQLRYLSIIQLSLNEEMSLGGQQQALVASGFSTISGPTGNGHGHDSGFSILNEAGDAIYEQAYPDDHSPCYNTGDGREFTIEGDCWATSRKFKCKSNFAGIPESCEVKDGNGNSLGSGEGATDIKSIGIAIITSGSCAVEFDSDSDGCPIDHGNGPLHVTSG
ncbi:hypothetical protein N7445_005810 [Penicillium cf. griseofulvum]|nr:hypothetical protein N7445_005810 [Penicillium cf. griseofulvum]